MKKIGIVFLVIAMILTLMPTNMVVIAATNLLTNSGFEEGTTNGWYPYGTCTIAASTAQVHGGSYSALVSARTQTWNGIAQNMLSKMTVGKAYLISGWVRLANSASDTVKITMKKVDGSTTSYDTVASGTATNTGWIQLSGTYTLQGTSITGLEPYFEGAAVGVDFYVDDVSLEEVSTDWKADANARIEQIRKRDAQVKVVDANNQPISGATVQVKQT